MSWKDLCSKDRGSCFHCLETHTHTHTQIDFKHQDVGVSMSVAANTAAPTTGNIISVRSQTHEVLLIDVALEGAQTVRFADVPQLQLTVCRPGDQRAA